MSVITKIKRIQLFQHERNLFALLKERGIDRAKVEELPEEFADRPAKKGETYYYYSGPLDDKTRPFCKKLLQLDKVISQLDIDILSNYLGYPVLEYEGSYNCRHKWVKFRGKFISTPELTVGQIKDLVKKGISAK